MLFNNKKYKKLLKFIFERKVPAPGTSKTLANFKCFMVCTVIDENYLYAPAFLNPAVFYHDFPDYEF